VSAPRIGLAVAAVALALGAGPAWAAESWVEVRSPAFAVVSDAGEKEARKVLLQFEQVRALLQEVWKGARVDTARPVTILAVRDEGALRALLPEYWEKKGSFHPDGVFVGAPDRSWVALRTDVARYRDGDETWDNPYLIVFHEYVHVVLRLNFSSLPAWLNEGLAEFWGNAIVEGDRVYEGRYVPYHLRTLRERTPMSLRALFAVTHGSPEASEQNRATLFYAQSWALVHYLVLGSDERQGQINRFAALLQANRPADEAAKEAFGDLGVLDRELQSYVRRPVFRYRRRAASLGVKEGEWAVRRLSEAESLALRAGFLAATGRATEARDLAGRSLALGPESAAAHETLALLAWRGGRRDEARETLRRATALPGASDFAHYLLGQLLWETLEPGESLDPVEAAFRRAVERNPNFAAAHASLARVMAERGAPLGETLPVAVRAAQLEPGEIEHSLTALRLAARAGGVEQARAQAATLLARSEGRDRERVEALLRELAPPAPPPRLEPTPPEAPAGPLTVAFEFRAEDARGRPVANLRPDEVEVTQDAARQKVETFVAAATPGLYEVTYEPASAKAGAVSVRVKRGGTVVRGPDGGPALRPRVIAAASPLEAELEAVLEARRGASDLACDVAVLRFEPGPKGTRHAVAVEIALSELRFDPAATGRRGRLQVLARLRPEADPKAAQNVTLDQAVEVSADTVVNVQRLVWTGAATLAPGRHAVDVLVRDPGSGRATVRSLVAEVPPPADELRLSSVTLLRPRSFFFLREEIAGDDPLVHEGTPLMPTLSAKLSAGADTHVRFYVAIYPAAGGAAPVTLRAELLRGGAKVGEAPIDLPRAGPSAEIRYVGLLATKALPAGSYVLRLVARQGDGTVADEASFELSADAAPRRLDPDGRP
jgi:tetratricopeptide (TPR) repeat protein